MDDKISAKSFDGIKKFFSKSNTRKNWKLFLNYFEKKQRKFISAFFWSDIFLLILMFFCSIFLNAKTGYYLDTLHFDQYNFLLIPGIVFGSIALVLFLIIWFCNAMLWIKVFILKKDFKNLLFYFYLSLNIVNFVIFIFMIVFSVIDYRLVYILEIILIFHTIGSLYIYLDNKYELDFKFIKKLNRKISKIIDEKIYKK